MIYHTAPHHTTPHHTTPQVEYDIYEVSEMRMENGAMWRGTQDHSKW